MADISKIKLPNGNTYNLKDNSGTYVKKAGDTVGPNALTVTDTVGTVVNISPIALYQSPIPKYLWHDLWAFCRAATPKFYQTTNGTTWVEKTLDKSIFAQKEAHSGVTVIDENFVGSRWEWDGGSFMYCMGHWLVIGVIWNRNPARFDVLLETSSGTGDSAEWTTLLDVKNVGVVMEPVWIKTNSPNYDNLRLTITRNSSSGSDTKMGITALKYLSSRWGNQGRGSEYEYPYTWDSNGNIELLPNTMLSGTVSHAKQLSDARTIDGVDFDGTTAITHYGTCSTAAGTADKTVSIPGFKLVTGAVALVRFSNSNSAAVANLTLNVNGTGAKHIKYGNANLSSAGLLVGNRTYPFVYDGTYWQLAGDLDYNDTANTVRTYSPTAKCGNTAIVAGNIIVAGTDGLYKHLKLGTAFDTAYPIFIAGSAMSANTWGSNNRVYTNGSLKPTQSITLTQGKPVYIKGHLNGTVFTPISIAPLTQTVPTSADGCQYMYLGVAYSNESIWLDANHPIYQFRDGKFALYEELPNDTLDIQKKQYIQQLKDLCLFAEIANGS